MNCQIYVVNKQKRSCDIEVDRHYGSGMDSRRLGEQGCFGNPYKMNEETPEERRRVIQLFKRDWLDWWQSDEQLRSWWAMKIDNNDHLRLGCHCAPKPCHADIIRATLIMAFDLDGDIEQQRYTPEQ